MKKLYQLTGLLIAMSIFVPLHAANEFAEEKIVLQISDPDPFKQTLVLNVASNLIKHYGPDKVAIEIVAFGPGLRLLFEKNPNNSRIQSLSASNVEFAACGNTITNMNKTLGHPLALTDKATVVPGGAVRIIELQNQGYKLLKP